MQAQIGRARKPRQQRGIETRERIIDAALHLFCAKGYHGTNSKEIAAAAGVSIGSFYCYFEDKKMLFLEILDKNFLLGREHLQEHVRAMQDNFSMDGTRTLLRGFIKNLFSAHQFSTEFNQEAAALILCDPDIRQVHDEHEAALIGEIASYIALFGDTVRVKDTEAAAFLVYRSVETVMHAARHPNQGISEDRLVDELTDMLAAYLFCGNSTF
ncbi:MAG TPA: TetR/AcrR family transcriptional regulator [Candidatus Aquicultor sp.]|jgi:AcrR family transcriptional regulator